MGLKGRPSAQDVWSESPAVETAEAKAASGPARRKQEKSRAPWSRASCRTARRAVRQPPQRPVRRQNVGPAATGRRRAGHGLKDKPRHSDRRAGRASGAPCPAWSGGIPAGRSGPGRGARSAPADGFVLVFSRRVGLASGRPLRFRGCRPDAHRQPLSPATAAVPGSPARRGRRAQPILARGASPDRGSARPAWHRRTPAPTVRSPGCAPLPCPPPLAQAYRPGRDGRGPSARLQATCAADPCLFPENLLHVARLALDFALSLVGAALGLGVAVSRRTPDALLD